MDLGYEPCGAEKQAVAHAVTRSNRAQFGDRLALDGLCIVPFIDNYRRLD